MENIKKLLKNYGWAILLVILYFSGAFKEMAYYTQQAAMLTGFLDAKPEPDTEKEPFNYNFFVKDLSGKKMEFAEFKGKVVFLNLWATWCPPCRAEMPSIQKLYEGLPKDKIVFAMISLDKDGTQEKVKSFVKKNSYTFPVFMPSGGLSDQLNVPSIPTTLVIDKSGAIVFKEAGTKNYNTPNFKKFISDLALDQ